MAINTSGTDSAPNMTSNNNFTFATSPHVIMLDVGGRKFTTTNLTLTSQSAYFAALLSTNWKDNASRVGEKVFIDADPDLFEHILSYLRRSVPPIFWTRTNGFDHPLYAALHQEAKYFGITGLEKWIADKRYMESVTVVHSIETVDLNHCLGSGLRQRSDDIEKSFDVAEYTTSGGLKRKRLYVQTTTFKAPDSLID